MVRVHSGATTVCKGRYSPQQLKQKVSCRLSYSSTTMGGETKDTMASSKEYPTLVARPVGKKVSIVLSGIRSDGVC